MSDTRYYLDSDLIDELKGIIEDSIEFFCDEYMISGELSWLVTQCLATTKIEQLKGNVN